MARELRPAERRARAAGTSYYKVRDRRAREDGFDGYADQQRWRKKVDPDGELPRARRREVAIFAHNYEAGDMKRDQIRDTLDDLGYFQYRSTDDFWEFLRELYE